MKDADTEKRMSKCSLKLKYYAKMGMWKLW